MRPRLVVDDEEDILELVEYNLSREGYKVTCVETGEAALREARTGRERNGQSSRAHD